MTKKIKDLTEREIKDICNKNCKNCRKCPLVITQSDKHIDCMLTPELVRTQEKEIEVTENGDLKQAVEEQLGCPLEVREKSFNKGFYDESGNHYICEHYVPYLKEMHTRGIMSHTEKCFKLRDYKKTWWLKNDMSE